MKKPVQYFKSHPVWDNYRPRSKQTVNTLSTRKFWNRKTTLRLKLLF